MTRLLCLLSAAMIGLVGCGGGNGDGTSSTGGAGGNGGTSHGTGAGGSISTSTESGHGGSVVITTSSTESGFTGGHSSVSSGAGVGGGQGSCSAETCPFGCCDTQGQCQEDDCQLYGVPCGGNPVAGGSTCQLCEPGEGCETCDTESCTACVPDCSGKACGDPDGCGSRCSGPCGSGTFCSIALGQCWTGCDTVSCPNGCCDDSGSCQPGLTDASCGWLGSTCQTCNANGPHCLPFGGSPPEGGKCQSCNSTSCPAGCCTEEGHCDDSHVDASCGANGAACADCTAQGSVCLTSAFTCSACTPDCTGKACGDADGCGSVCSGECATGKFCFPGDAAHASGCVSCDADTCPNGCCSSTGECLSGSDRKACGGGGGACADCGAEACKFDFNTFQNDCGACGCPPPDPNTSYYCFDDGCGNLCPGGSCPTEGPFPSTCGLGPNGHAQCSMPGFCSATTCAGCCDGTGTCQAGNLPTSCGGHGVECVDCVSKGDSCDVTSQTCEGCTPDCGTLMYASCGYGDGCGGICTGAEGGTCAPGAECSDTGTCSCTTPGQALCYDANFDQSCIDVTSDPLNCGACNVECPSGVACVEGQCQCPPATHFCPNEQTGVTGVCTNLATDSDHCGECYASCSGTPCVDGVCGTCGADKTQCPSGCTDLTDDNSNCGACGNVCPVGVTCLGGECPCQESGQVSCNGTCTDLDTDPTNCGKCGTACPTGVSCEAGQCVCPGGATLCSGVCTNTDVDPKNCGHCGTTCPPGHSCVAGVCP